MIILDTNVISALMRSTPEQPVVAWLDKQPADSVWTTTISVFEIRYGLRILPGGKKRERLEAAFDAVLKEDLDKRLLDFDYAAANEAGHIVASLRETGRPVDVRDVQIAGIVVARRGTLATGNTAHFASTGVALINPWTD